MLFLLILTSSRTELCGRDQTQWRKKWPKFENFQNYLFSKDSDYLNFSGKEIITRPIDRAKEALSNSPNLVPSRASRLPSNSKETQKLRTSKTHSDGSQLVEKKQKKAYESCGMREFRA